MHPVWQEEDNYEKTKQITYIVIFDFNIEDEDMAIMDTLNEDLHTSHVPDDLKDVIF